MRSKRRIGRKRKTVRQIDIKSLQKTNHYNNDTTDINELTNSDETVNDEVIDNNIEIPDILIPQSEPEPMPQTELDKDFAPLNM